jgi:hypothetical protein
MENISLNIISEDHIFGHWEVKDRIVNPQNKHLHFSSISNLELKKGVFISYNGKKSTGKFKMVREEEIIYNPQLFFYINKDYTANAITTRLFTETTDKSVIYKLTLYFTSGLELVLHKINPLRPYIHG